MIQRYRQFIRSAYKNFLKHKVPNVLNVTGLSVGIAVAILIGWWCYNTFTYDKFHKDGDSIHLLTASAFMNNESMELVNTFGGVGSEAKTVAPEIEDVIKVYKEIGVDLTIKNNRSKCDLISVGDNFFDFFTFTLLSGSVEGCFATNESIVITEEFALKNSLGSDPIGESIEIGGKIRTVSAVMNNVPSNSTLQFDAIIPLKSTPQGDYGWMEGDMFITYLKLPEGSNYSDIADRLTKLAVKNISFLGKIEYKYSLTPLDDIYFSGFGNKMNLLESGDSTIAIALLLMVLTILILASVNFINLYVSTAFFRIKTIAIKRSNGASRGSVVKMMFAESALYVLLSIIIGLFITLISYPTFNDLFESKIEFDLTDIRLLLLVFSIGLVTVVTSAAYPAIVFSKVNIIDALKGGLVRGKSQVVPKILLVLQIVISTVFLIVVITMKKQINYMINSDHGFDIDNTICFYNFSAEFTKSYDTVREELKRDPNIIDVTGASSFPTYVQGNNGISVPGVKDPFLMETTWVKSNYLNQMGLEIIQGDEVGDVNGGYNGVYLNERALDILQLKEPIGTEIVLGGEWKHIVKGVLKNYNLKSMRDEIYPQILIPKIGGDNTCRVVFVKFRGNPNAVLPSIEKIWKEYNRDGGEFDYQFLNESYEKVYKDEIVLGQIITWGLGIVLLITLFGLFAIVKFSTERKTKEIGIHIINGAVLYDIIKKFSLEFLKVVVIASVLGAPIGYYLGNKWLEGFAFRTDISWWIYLIAIGVTAIPTVIIVACRSLSVTNLNPVDTLRSE